MPQQDTALGLIEKYLQDGRNSLAMRELVKISNECSKDLKFLNLLARTQSALSDTAALIKTLTVISHLDPTNANHFALMRALYSEGRLNEALDIGLKLQEMQLSENEISDLNRVLIAIYLEFNDYEGIEELIMQSEVNDFTSWAMGLVYLARMDKDSALKSFRQSIELNAMNDRAWVSLAVLHDEMGDRELALANLEKSLDANSKNSLALKLMAKWYPRTIQKSNEIMSRVRFYLAEHNFDEEISLCYVQILRENNMVEIADLEMSKLILNNPYNSELASLKKNLQADTNI